MSIPPFLDLPPGVLSQTLLTPRGPVAVLDNRELAGEEHPSRGTALFVPGFTGSKEDFIAILGPLGEAGRRAVAVDLAGQFQTPGPDDPSSYSLAGFAADVASVASELGGEVDLVGHSMGGLVAREVVLAHPLSVRTLVLMDSGPHALPEDQQLRLRMFAGLLSQHGLDVVWAAKQAMDEEAGAASPSHEHIADFLTQRFLANAPASLLAMVEVLCNEPDRTDELAALAPRSLVLTGEQDDVWPPALQAAMATRLSATYAQLEGIGHSPAADAPSLTAQTLLEFWTQD